MALPVIRLPRGELIYIISKSDAIIIVFLQGHNYSAG